MSDSELPSDIEDAAVRPRYTIVICIPRPRNLSLAYRENNCRRGRLRPRHDNLEGAKEFRGQGFSQPLFSKCDPCAPRPPCCPPPPTCPPPDCSDCSLKDMLMQCASGPSPHPNRKVTVVGCGMVGMATALALLTQNITNDLALVDINDEKVQGEVLDLNHGSLFLQNANVVGSTDYKISADSAICIVTAGVRQKTGETRLDLVQRNTDVMKLIIPQLMKYSPDAMLLLVTNPVDILTYVCWKLTGIPQNKCIGTGTTLDSSRFRWLISKRFDVAPSSVQGWILGEHGDSSVPIWSGVTVGGTNLRTLKPLIGTDKDDENWAELPVKVVKAGYQVRGLKGFSNWAIGLSTAYVVQELLANAGVITPVSVYSKGYYGIEHDVFLSLPCQLGEKGIVAVIQPVLDPDEIQKLQKSAKILHDIQKGLKL